jgi:hypothetical protein
LSVPAPAAVAAYSVPAAIMSALTRDTHSGSDHKHIRFSKTTDST